MFIATFLIILEILEVHLDSQVHLFLFAYSHSPSICLQFLFFFFGLHSLLLPQLMEDSQVLKQKLMLDVTAPELLEKEQGLSLLRWSKAFSGG